MKRADVFKFLFKWAWAIVAACMAVFFVTALLVYTQAEPSGISELLKSDDTWIWTKTLSETPGDLEVYPYVTKVYSYGTNKDSLDIYYTNEIRNYPINYGIVEDESAEYNYYVECFVHSDIADKNVVKRAWGMSVQEGDVLTFTQTKTDSPYIVGRWSYSEYNEIKKESSKVPWYFDTFVRITVKPGYNNVNFSNNEQTDNTVIF